MLLPGGVTCPWLGLLALPGSRNGLPSAARCLPPLRNGDRPSTMSTEHDPPRRGEASGAPYDDLASEGRGRGGSEAESPVSEPVPGSTSSKAAKRSAARRAKREQSPNMLPGRGLRRSAVESLLVRLIATCGIVGIGVA